MTPLEGVPWQPPPLDEFLERPFAELEERREAHALVRLEAMDRRLEELERELDAMLLENSPCS